MKTTVKRQRFALLEKIKARSLSELTNREFHRCFKDWKDVWHKWIVSGGDYFEGNSINFEE